MISAEEFLDLLEQKDLLPNEMIDHLREQLAAADGMIPASSVAARLVEKGELTKTQARRLLGSGAETPTASKTPVEKKPVEKKPIERKPVEKRPVEEPPAEEDFGLTPLDGDELRLAPLDEDPPKPETQAKQKPKPQAKPAAAKPTPSQPKPRQAPPARSAPSQPAQEPAQRQPAAQTPPTASSEPRSLLDEELTPLDGGPGAPGSLGGLLDETMLDASAAAAGSLLTPVGAKKKGFRSLFQKKKGPKKQRENVWDSPLLLIGGGTLVALVIVGVVLVLVMNRGSGDELLEEGHKHYDGGSWANAIAVYDQYLEKYGSHHGASTARVRRGTALLWQQNSEAKISGDWSQALAEARVVLDEISSEEDFPQVHDQLATLLLDISGGLADNARKTLDPAVADEVDEALILVQKLSREQRLAITADLEKVKSTLAQARHDINRDNELKQAIAGMKEAAGAGKPREAYEIRSALLREYSELADDDLLREAVRVVSQSQKDAVKVVPLTGEGTTMEVVSAVSIGPTLVRRMVSGTATGVDDRFVFVQSRGVAYGLDATSGEVKWRRFVGSGVNGRTIPPVPQRLSEDPGGDVLLVDSPRSELLRVDGATGKLRWRFTVRQSGVADPFVAQPVVVGDRILVATRSGRLVVLDQDEQTCTAKTGVELSQELRVSPAVNPAKTTIYQVADHSNLFVLSADDHQCREVVYLGHEPGRIVVPPVVMRRFVIIAENHTSNDSRLRVLQTDLQGRSVKESERSYDLRGRVDVAPVVSGNRLLVTTDKGKAYVFGPSSANKVDELTNLVIDPLDEIVKETAIPGEENVIRYPLLRNTECWLAGDWLIKYNVLATDGKLVTDRVLDKECVFTQPPTALGRVVFTTREEPGLTGALVSARDMDEGEQLWETLVGAPLAGSPLVEADSQRITAVTAAGGLYRIADAQLTQAAILDQPTIAVPPTEVRRSLTDMCELEDGHLAVSSGKGAEVIARFDAGAAQPRQSSGQLDLVDPLACSPLPFDSGLLAATTKGQIVLLDLQTGAPLAEPFQPTRESGVEILWRGLAAVDGQRFLVSDGRTKLYLVGIQDQPTRNLAALAENETDLPEPIVSPIAVLGQVAYAVDGARQLIALKLPPADAAGTPALTRSEVQSLAAPCSWGPQRVGDRVLLKTAGNRLLCVDDQQKVQWAVSAPEGVVAGPPMALDKDFVLAFTDGVVWRISQETGKEIARLDTGVPLAGGPVPWQGKLLLSGHDGTLYTLDVPPEEK
ncbi:MAG: PQQ-binding-like beta-propeller repeat protein [Planctomycetes bacterium]|nr:PQQ-binding-like beta-propeller repeat protein [Planctomycetota bacterium]